MPNSHKQEIEAIRKFVKLLGGRVNVLHQSGRLQGSAGIPDLYLQIPEGHFVKRGVSLWMEVKVGGDSLRAAQREFVAWEHKAGDIPTVYGGLESVMTFLKTHGHISEDITLLAAWGECPYITRMA